MAASSIEQWQILIYGHVQGVYFRASVKKFIQDEQLALRGFVRNHADGSVEVCAQGKTEELERLLIYCHQGPRAARVDHVDWHAQTTLTSFSKFEII